MEKHLIPNSSIGAGNNVLQINKKAYFSLNSGDFYLDKDFFVFLVLFVRLTTLFQSIHNNLY